MTRHISLSDSGKNWEDYNSASLQRQKRSLNSEKEKNQGKGKNTETRIVNQALRWKILNNWKQVPLSDVISEIYYGVTARATVENTGIRMLRTTDIKNYSFDAADLPFCEITEERKDLKRFLLKKGDIVVARAGSVGISVIIEKDFANTIFGSYLIKIKPKSNLDSRFLYYFFQSDMFWRHLQRAQGSTLKNINVPLLRSLSIPEMPICEQQKIAEILASVDDTIQKTQLIIEETQRLKKGLMQQLFTRGIGRRKFKKTEMGEIPEEWRINVIREITSEFISGGTPDTSKKEYWEGNIPWITGATLVKRILTRGERNITEKGLGNSATNIVPKNAILLVTRTDVGKVAKAGINIAINQDMTGIVINHSKADSDYILWYLVGNQKRLKRYQQGTTIQGILRRDVENLEVALPPLPEQQKIAAILSSVDEKIQKEEQYKSQLQILKKGLMQDLLTGKVRVKVEN